MEFAQVVVVEHVVQHSTATDILTAVGTVGATILALFGIYRAWWMRPRLSMRMQIEQPPNADLVAGVHLLMEQDRLIPEEQPMPSGWVRARVTSRRGAATAVEVVLLGGSLTDGAVSKRVDVEGLSLRWSGHGPPVTQCLIAPGLPRHIDIGYVIQHRSSPAPFVLHTAFKPNNRRNEIKRGTLALYMAATSTNGPPAYYQVVLAYDGTWPAGDPIWQHLAVVTFKKQRPPKDAAP